MKKGFTLIEVLIVVTVLAILFSLSFPSFSFFKKKSQLNSSTEEILTLLRLAQSKTLRAQSDNNWGVYFRENEVILFKGPNYNSRIIEFDRRSKLPEIIKISSIDLIGGGAEIVFQRLTGTAAQTGMITLEIVNQPEEKRNLCIKKYIIDNCEI